MDISCRKPLSKVSAPAVLSKVRYVPYFEEGASRASTVSKTGQCGRPRENGRSGLAVENTMIEGPGSACIKSG